MKLILLFKSGATYLQNAYQEFPNNPILWLFHDRSWHALLKTISGILYAQQYDFSTWYGIFEIKKEFIDSIKIELEKFEAIIVEKTLLLKIELLKKAAKLVNEIKIDTLAELAEKKIDIIESSKTNMNSIPLSNSIYRFYMAYHANKQQAHNVKEEQTFSPL